MTTGTGSRSRADAAGTAAPSLSSRVPAHAVMTELLRAHAALPPRSRLARALGRSPLTDDTRPWFQGALGEVEVARHMARLEPQWRVLHAVPVGAKGSDIDHVVIGPGGVFTLNAKHHAGQSVWVGGRTLMVGGQKVPHVRNAGHEALRAGQRLTAALGREVTVRGIIAVVGAKSLTVKEQPATVTVLTAQRLVRWLHQQPAVLGPEDVAAIAAVAARPGTWHERPAPWADGALLQQDFAALQREVVAARRTSAAWRLTGAGAGAAGLAVLGPHAVEAAGHAVLAGLAP